LLETVFGILLVYDLPYTLYMIYPTQANREKNELKLQITEDSMFSKHLRIFLVTSIEAYERGNFETRN